MDYKGKSYIDSTALQYLNCPASMESLTLTEFVLDYHVARKSKDNEELMTFLG